MTTTYRLTIYAGDARTILRETAHATRRQALRSRDDYERRHDHRYPHCITRLPAPEGGAADEWDDWRISQGISGR